MTERNYYVLCDDNCKFESMTKEQIIDAIAEATGAAPTPVDEAFITQIKEQNANHNLKIWKGTEAQYNALAEKDSDTLYIVGTNKVGSIVAVEAAVTDLETALETAVTDLETKVNELLYVSPRTLVGTQRLDSESSQFYRFNISKSGYTPIAIAGLDFMESDSANLDWSKIRVHGFYVTGGGRLISELVVGLENTKTSAQTVKVSARVLYMKNN